MHEALDSDLRSDFGDPLRTRDMDIGKLEVPTKEENKKKEGSKHVSRTRLEKKKEGVTWSRNLGQRDCTQYQSASDTLLFVLHSGYPIPKYVAYDIHQTNCVLLRTRRITMGTI